MTDIVERLRTRKGFWLNGGAWMMGTEPDRDCAEAADEIERLRAALDLERRRLAVSEEALRRADQREIQAMSEEKYTDLYCLKIENEAMYSEIKRLRARVSELVSQLDEQYGTPCEQIRHQQESERLREALHNIGIGGNGERNWTLDEVRAVAWDALEPEP
jgi:SMC interacting uncharacterized protein involved in chromosome segregation